MTEEDKIKEIQQILNNYSLPSSDGGFIRDDKFGLKFKGIAEAIVKKLNIDDVSKCPYCNSEYVNKTYNYCNSCKKHYN